MIVASQSFVIAFLLLSLFVIQLAKAGKKKHQRDSSSDSSSSSSDSDSDKEKHHKGKHGKHKKDKLKEGWIDYAGEAGKKFFVHNGSKIEHHGNKDEGIMGHIQDKMNGLNPKQKKMAEMAAGGVGLLATTGGGKVLFNHLSGKKDEHGGGEEHKKKPGLFEEGKVLFDKLQLLKDGVGHKKHLGEEQMPYYQQEQHSIPPQQLPPYGDHLYPPPVHQHHQNFLSAPQMNPHPVYPPPMPLHHLQQGDFKEGHYSPPAAAVYPPPTAYDGVPVYSPPAGYPSLHGNPNPSQYHQPNDNGHNGHPPHY